MSKVKDSGGENPPRASEISFRISKFSSIFLTLTYFRSYTFYVTEYSSNPIHKAVHTGRMQIKYAKNPINLTRCPVKHQRQLMRISSNRVNT